MAQILFLDECCPKPYGSKTLYSQSQGGTESTVTRVADGLAARGHEVRVEQSNREFMSQTAGLAAYGAPGRWGAVWVPDRVVCLRLPQTLYKARERFPEAEMYLWAHDLYSPEHAAEVAAAISETKAGGIVCVSDFHKAQILDAMYQGKARAPSIHRIYNPIDPFVTHDPCVPYDPYQLAWLSSPHKGLKEAIKMFGYLRGQDSRFKLIVHNPGYYKDAVSNQPGVTIKPQGTFQDGINTLRSSLCLFYPNMVFPETFGLVLAESDAVGTPVLCHPIGAAQEVLDHPLEVMDCTRVQEVVDRVVSWSQGQRPTVRGKKAFELPRVLRAWEGLF